MVREITLLHEPMVIPNARSTADLSPENDTESLLKAPSLTLKTCCLGFAQRSVSGDVVERAEL